MKGVINMRDKKTKKICEIIGPGGFVCSENFIQKTDPHYRLTKN
jgi:hypothetical protein